MKKIYLEFLLITILILFLIVKSAFFVDILAHEYYHAYKNKPYSESICFDLTKINKAYTVINYPNLTAKMQFSKNPEIKEEIKANHFGRLISFIYILFIGLIASLFLIVLKRK